MLDLRPFQKEALRLLENPGALICVAPTGAGKSLIYEKTALNPGVRMVLFTPLIALARQQAEKLRGAGVDTRLGAGPASDPPPTARSGAWILSPEKLSSRAIRAHLARWSPNFVVVDECHCLWDWGERFRPAFREIPRWMEAQTPERSLWLTATLPRSAREELKRDLDRQGPVRELGEFSLPGNLHLRIERCPWADRPGRLLEWVRSRHASGIIFVQTRESAHRLTRLLAATGVASVYYHAGMGSEERRNTELLIQKRIPHVIVATSAFGMGMDHPHLQWVALWQAPPSLLSLAQALGRAGRDVSARADAWVLWDDDDFNLLQWIAHGSERRKEELQSIRRFLTAVKCRRTALRDYFEIGEGVRNPLPDALCERCDFCSNSGAFPPRVK